jgi:hypothetical protein
MKPETWRNFSFISGLVMILVSMFLMRYLVKFLIWLG